MNRTLFIIIICLIALSCDFNKNEKANKQKNITTQKTDSFLKNYKYSIRVLVIESKNKRKEYSAYISKDNDTIITQHKSFINNVLDTVNSNYYDLDLYKINSNTYSGKITLHSSLDKLGPYTNTLKLDFLGCEKTFEASNQDFIEFKLKSESDTLMGLLYEIRSIDTIINGEKMVRIIQSVFPIDTKQETDNPYVEIFAKNGYLNYKNER